MSRVDYSRWDNIELSDDEDVEVHPNVDKKSFIKWRQEKIHADRAERRHGIDQYAKQLEWIDKYLDLLAQFPDAPKPIVDQTHTLLSEFAGVPENLQFTRVVPNTPAAWEKFRAGVRAHRATLVSEREKLVVEESKKLSVDSISKPGFESTRINKGASAAAAAGPPPAKVAGKASGKKSGSAAAAATATEIEVLNPGAVAKGKQEHVKEAAAVHRGPEDVYLERDETVVYANLNMTDYKATYAYLRDHTWLVSQAIADEILAAAFQCEMDGKHEKCKRYVHQAQVLQFCVNLGPNGAPMFFSKIGDPGHQATQMFRADIQRTLAHIVQRSAVLNAKKKGTLQSAVDLSPENPAKMEVFRDLPENVQKALLTEDLAAVEAALDAHPRQRDALRAKLVKAEILRDPNAPAPKKEEEVLTIKEEEKINLFQELPKEFGQALLDGDLDKAQELMTTYDEPTVEKVLDLCKRGGFLEFEEVDEHGTPIPDEEDKADDVEKEDGGEPVAEEANAEADE
ncbi:hypothetical protein BC828DRAFT_378123 [Blastocladiella britannica]|nr:hypothetical protein BC828DRAFT_378123 [Blastocladiella britannica]